MRMTRDDRGGGGASTQAFAQYDATREVRESRRERTGLFMTSLIVYLAFALGLCYLLAYVFDRGFADILWSLSVPLLLNGAVLAWIIKPWKEK